MRSYKLFLNILNAFLTLNLSIAACSPQEENLRSHTGNVDEANGDAEADQPVPSVPKITGCALDFEEIGEQAFGDGLEIITPKNRQVSQRNTKGVGTILVKGAFSEKGLSCAEVRVFEKAKNTPWIKLSHLDIRNNSFSCSFELKQGGWYALELRVWSNEQKPRASAIAKIEKIGVGDVFVIAGQSNSTNSGATRQTPKEDRVSAWNGSSWQFAADPQPMVADNSGGGSPWPVMGDELVAKLNVPIGIVSVGHHSTIVAQWQPGGPLYSKLRDTIRVFENFGVRAVLWHQGESDTGSGTSQQLYANLLANTISKIRQDVGFDVPWFIAGASFSGISASAAIRAAQDSLINNKLNFRGAITDDLLGSYRSADGVHFSDSGLKAHGHRWAEAILQIIK